MRQIASLISRAVHGQQPAAELAEEVGALVERFPAYPRDGHRR